MYSKHENDLARLQQQLRRAEHWAFRAESDAEYESARQLIIWFELQISELQQKAA